MYVNEAYCTGSEENAIEIQGGEQAFSSAKVPDLGDHHYVAINDLHVTMNQSPSSGLIKFEDALAVKNSGEVAAPTYQTLISGFDAPNYVPLNGRSATPNYQQPNSEGTSPTYQPINGGLAASTYQPPNRGSGSATPIYQPLNSESNASTY